MSHVTDPGCASHVTNTNNLFTFQTFLPATRYIFEA